MRRMNAPLPTREAVYTNEAIENTRGLTVTVWYTIAGVPEVRTGISQGVEEAHGTSATQGKYRKPENDVVVIQDPHRSTNPTPNRLEKVGQWSGVGDLPEGHCQVKDEAGIRWLYKKIYDNGGTPVPVEYRIPINRITKLSAGSEAVVGGSIEKEMVKAA